MRIFYTILGLLFVGLALLGCVLPILPTTPFLLLALWFFSRSSPRLKNWLLTNRLFGKYIDDFHNGRGIPKAVKVYTIILLWVTIGCSAIFFTDLLWVRIMLFVVAVGVTIHILRFKTKHMSKKIVILTPTAGEAARFEGLLPHDVDVITSGVGMAATAEAVVRAVATHKPALVILAGIAGAYPNSGVSVGDCVLVGSERIADLGALRDGRFVPLYQQEYACSHAQSLDVLPVVASCTVSVGAADFTDAGNEESTGFARGAIENMEGAAFFSVCLALGVPFLEVRAISNLTTDPRSEWQIEQATLSLAEGVRRCLPTHGINLPDANCEPTIKKSEDKQGNNI